MNNQLSNDKIELLPKSEIKHLKINFCGCQVDSATYFKTYTIICALSMLITIVGIISTSFKETSLRDCFILGAACIFLILYMIVFTQFKRNNYFGTNTAIALSILMIITTVLMIIAVIIEMVLIIGFEKTFLHDLDNVQNKFIIIWGSVILVLLIFILFLDVMYLKSISKERNQNKKKFLEHIDSITVI